MRITLLPEEHAEVLSTLEDMAQPNLVFVFLIALSTGIAAFGLLADSTAVVIGAMLIAPLMGPIFAIALGLVRGDRRLLLKAGWAEILGVVLAVAMAMAIGLVPLRPEFGAEILARTQPTLYDIFVALFSGIAGAYSIVNKKVSTAIAGVAIATALVPPLATCGLLLGSQQFKPALGAFLLFLANFVAIQFAAAVIFLLAGLGEAHEHRRTWGGLLHVLLPGLVALALLGVLMTRTLVQVITQQRLEGSVRASLQRQLDSILGARLERVDIQTGTATDRVIATVLTPHEFTPPRVDEMERKLRSDTAHELELVVRSLLSRDVNRSGTVFLTEEEKLGMEEQRAESVLLERASAIVRMEMEHFPEARLVELVRDTEAAKPVLVAIVETPEALEPGQVARVERTLKQQLPAAPRLVVRSLLTRIADAEKFVESTRYEPPLDDEERALANRLRGWLGQELSRLAQGVKILDFRLGRDPNRDGLTAVVTLQAPRSIEPREVERIQNRMPEAGLPPVRFILRTTVASDVDATGYLADFDPAAVIRPAATAQPTTEAAIADTARGAVRD